MPIWSAGHRILRSFRACPSSRPCESRELWRAHENPVKFWIFPSPLPSWSALCLSPSLPRRQAAPRPTLTAILTVLMRSWLESERRPNSSPALSCGSSPLGPRR